MRTENLMKACQSFDVFYKHLQEAHSDAVKSENQFAEVAIHFVLTKAAKFYYRLERLKDATQ